MLLIVSTFELDDESFHVCPPTPPPPPPPPPHPPARPRQLQAITPPVPPLPSNYDPKIKISKEAYAAAMGIKLGEPVELFAPCYMFFYGSLMDVEVLRSVLGLPSDPSVMKGELHGFSMKMWGIYPTLIRDQEGGKVSGTVWKIDNHSHFLRLQEYETKAYTWCFCDVELANGSVLHECRTFCWAGDPDSKELEEGSFDLVRYQKYFKASVVRK